MFSHEIADLSEKIHLLVERKSVRLHHLEAVAPAYCLDFGKIGYPPRGPFAPR